MGNVVSSAIHEASKLYGTNADTQWYVTFSTNEIKLGKIRSLDREAYLLIGERWVYFFDVHHVVHLSPHLRK